MEIFGILAAIARNIVQLFVGIFHATAATMISQCQNTSPHGSGDAGTTYDQETTNLRVVHDNASIWIGNHSDIRNTTLLVTIETVLIRWAALKCTQTTAATVPRGLAYIRAVRFDLEGCAAN